MRRIISVVAVVTIMAALVAATALPVFAQASENAGCVGQALSTAGTTLPPGSVGNTIGSFAVSHPAGVVGEEFTGQTQEPREDCPEL
jgi:hypothetical protein